MSKTPDKPDYYEKLKAILFPLDESGNIVFIDGVNGLGEEKPDGTLEIFISGEEVRERVLNLIATSGKNFPNGIDFLIVGAFEPREFEPVEDTKVEPIIPEGFGYTPYLS